MSVDPDHYRALVAAAVTSGSSNFWDLLPYLTDNQTAKIQRRGTVVAVPAICVRGAYHVFAVHGIHLYYRHTARVLASYANCPESRDRRVAPYSSWMQTSVEAAVDFASVTYGDRLIWDTAAELVEYRYVESSPRVEPVPVWCGLSARLPGGSKMPATQDLSDRIVFVTADQVAAAEVAPFLPGRSNQDDWQIRHVCARCGGGLGYQSQTLTACVACGNEVVASGLTINRIPAPLKVSDAARIKFQIDPRVAVAKNYADWANAVIRVFTPPGSRKRDRGHDRGHDRVITLDDP